MPSAAAVKASATHAGASPGGIALGLSAVVVAAEGARVNAALTARLSVSSSLLPVPLERPGGFASTIAAHSALHIPFYAALASSPVVTAPVIKSSASRVVPAVVVDCVVVMPIESPMTPSPSKTAVPAD